MLKTVEGVINEDGTVALLEAVDAPKGQRVLVTVLAEAPADVPPPPWTIDWDDPQAVSERIAQARKSIREGRGYTIEQAKERIERSYAEKVRALTVAPGTPNV